MKPSKPPPLQPWSTIAEHASTIMQIRRVDKSDLPIWHWRRSRRIILIKSRGYWGCWEVRFFSRVDGESLWLLKGQGTTPEKACYDAYPLSFWQKLKRWLLRSNIRR